MVEGLVGPCSASRVVFSHGATDGPRTDGVPATKKRKEVNKRMKNKRMEKKKKL